MKADFKKLEEKWSKKWAENNIFTAKKDDTQDKIYVNVAYPYPSGAMHIGHCRTYTVPDIYARFKRMQGYNVLFPMAFHCTGSPVVGISERIKREDPKILDLYGGLYGVPKDVLATFDKPKNIVNYYSKEYMDLMTRLGLSIDWSRRFTTIDEHYKKFITWQYNTLKEKELVVQGKHPIRWCPHDENPVGDHDLLSGEDSSIFDYALILFDFDGLKLPCATLRAETVFGVTNLWINPEVTYIKAEVDGNLWLLSKEAKEKLKNQLRDVEEVGEIKGNEFVSKFAKNPLNGNDVVILPATFVDPDVGSGVVMSVPAHAPYDYQALCDIRKDKEFLSKFNLKPKDVDLDLISIIEVSGYGKYPAKEICEKMEISDQNDPKLEEATEIIYKHEFSRGYLKDLVSSYGKIQVAKARDVVREDMSREATASFMYDFSKQDVFCRCNTKCVVKILEDQWFLKYSDQDWKNKTKEAFLDMNLVPEEVRSNFNHVIDWLNDWACSRRVGLGTKLPWDDKWIVEPLSDSVIYMAYYTISHILNKIDPKNLDKDVFDYLFLSKSISTHPEIDKLKEMKEEFDYWYPYDYRFSAKDLIGNHLTFQVFHHTAIFAKKYWPGGIVVFGMGLLEGKKMSSSKGNVFLLKDALDEFGSDSVRVFLMSSSEPWQDFDWRNDQVLATKNRLENFYSICTEISDEKGPEEEIDRWIISKMNMRIKETTEALENFQTRKALQSGFFDFYNDYRWYQKRKVKKNSKIEKKIVNSWVKLLAPFAPFVCEEIWQILGEDEFISKSIWPKYNEEEIDQNLDLAETFIQNTISDIKEILKLLKIDKISKLTMITSNMWKWDITQKMLSQKTLNQKKLIPMFMKDEKIRKQGKKAVKFIQRIAKEIQKMPYMRRIDEKKVLNSASDFLKNEFGIDSIEVVSEKDSDHKKASQSMPFKPAIIVE